MGRVLLHRVNLFAVASALVAAPALAAIPAGYLGKPFDPAVAGGAGIVPPTVKAGPYALPGRVSFVNYDMGGDGVGYHTDAHYTTKSGDGYRSDRPSATLSKTGAGSAPDVWYDTGNPALDGTPYPNPPDVDFYVGSVHPGDWFNYTVDVKQAGTYALSSVFSTGNGPPGGEGGDGQMQLDIFVNGTKMTSWHTVLPDYQNKANFHNWKPYPSYAMITLEAGLQVIKFQAPFKHLNLDYVDFALMGASGTGGATGAAGDGAGGATGTAGAGGATGAAGGGATGAAGSTSGAAGGGATGAAGDGSGGASATGAGGNVGSPGAGGSTTMTAGAAGTSGPGAAGTSGTGAAGSGPKARSSGGCAVSGSPGEHPLRGVAGVAILAVALLTLARRRRR